ncbi:hypothetical protein [Frigoribacterium sp. UYMn621]|uniref:hypothetical protein n=1 Tax=Frigoribacterium sp. UYMn621 TaxID=3156343 RepID=UPI003398A0AA
MTDDFVIPFNNTVVAEGGGGSGALFPSGWKVLATVLPTTKDGTSITKRPYAREGVNAAITCLGVRFRIADGQKGQGRNLFADVPLARNLKSTGNGKFPDGTPAYFFFQFFRSLGYNVDAPEGFKLPADQELMGKEVELVLNYEAASNGNEARNVVGFINKAAGIPNNTALQAAADKLAAEARNAPAAGGGQPAQQAAAPTGWTPGTTPAAQPAQAPVQAPPAAAGPPPGWTPNASDVQAAQQQAQPVGSF